MLNYYDNTMWISRKFIIGLHEWKEHAQVDANKKGTWLVGHVNFTYNAVLFYYNFETSKVRLQ